MCLVTLHTFVLFVFTAVNEFAFVLEIALVKHAVNVDGSLPAELTKRCRRHPAPLEDRNSDS